MMFLCCKLQGLYFYLLNLFSFRTEESEELKQQQKIIRSGILTNA